MGQDQKNQNICTLLIEVKPGEDRGQFYKELVEALAGGPNIFDVNVSLLQTPDQILVASSRRPGQLPPEVRGRVQEILKKRFAGRCTVQNLHGASSQGLTGVRKIPDPALERRIGVLEEQLTKAKEDIGVYEGLQGEIKSMGAVAAYLVTRRDQPNRLEEMDRRYSEARRKKDGSISDGSLIELLKSTGVPFRSTDEYKTMTEKLERAKKLLKEGDEFVYKKRAEKFIKEAERTIAEADEKEKQTGDLRAAVAGKEIKYMAYIDDTQPGQTVHLVMPVKENMQGELSRELIGHVSSRVELLAGREVIDHQSGYNQGLKAFSLTPKSGTAEKIRDQLIREVVGSQGHYVFGAAGLRIDIESLTSTAGMKIELDEKPYRPTHGGKRTYADDGTSRAMFDTLRQKLPGLPNDAFNGSRGQTRLCYIATLKLLAESDKPLRPVELRKALPRYVDGYKSEKPSNKTNYPTLVRNLLEQGLLEKVGEGRFAPVKIVDTLRK